MPRKSKNEELKKWLSEATAANIRVVFETYSIVVTVIYLDGEPVSSDRIANIYPTAKEFILLSESKRVHI